MNVGGREHWTTKDAAAFFTQVKKDVQAGALDAEINSTAEGKGGASGARSGAGGTGRSASRPSRQGPMDPAKIYARNVKRFGAEKAKSLWEARFPGQPLPAA